MTKTRKNDFQAQREELTELSRRYQLAIDQIGGEAVMKALPGPLKTIVELTTDFKAKTELLEAIAEIKTM